MTDNRGPIFCIDSNDIHDILPYQKIFFVVVNSVTSVFAVVVNLLAILVIIKTKQLSTQSTHLTYVLFMTDIFSSIFSMTSISLVMWFGSTLGCLLNLMLDFLINLFFAAPTLITVLVSIDRYLHIKYLLDYPLVFTPKRYKMLLGVGFALITFQAVLGTIASIFSNGDGTKGKTVIVGIDFLLILISCVLYGVSYMVLSKKRRNGVSLGSSPKSITRIAGLYLISLVISKGFPLVISLICDTLNTLTSIHLHMGFVNLILNLVLNSYTFLNSFIFLYVNTKARKYIMMQIRVRLAVVNVIEKDDSSSKRKNNNSEHRV